MDNPANPDPHFNEPVDHPPVHPDQSVQTQPPVPVQTTPTDGHFVQTDTAPVAPPPKPTAGPMRKLMFLSLFILFVALLAVGGWWAYENVYLSPERITANAISKAQTLKNYKYDFSMSVTSTQTAKSSEQASSISDILGGLPISIALTGNGEADVSDPQNTKITGEFGLKTSFFVGFDFSARIIGSDVYVKPSGTLPANLLPGIEQVNESWIKIPASQTTQNTPSAEEIAKLSEKLPQLYAETPFMQFTEKLEAQTLDDQRMRRYKYSVDKDNLIKIFQQLYPSNISSAQLSNLDGLKFEDGEIWIGTFDSLIHKVIVNATIDVPNSASQYKFSVNFHMYDFDQGVNVNVPDNVVDLSTVFTRQYSQARDAQRRANLYTISNAVYAHAVTNNGQLPDGFPVQSTCIGTDPECFNLALFIVPSEIEEMPYDPNTGSPQNTNYFIYSENGRVIATAKSETGEDIIVQR